VWTAIEATPPASPRLSLAVYDGERRAFVLQRREEIDAADPLRALAARIAGALRQTVQPSSGRAAVGAETQPAAPARPAGVAGRRPWYRRWWVWALAGALVAGTATGLAVGLTRRESTGPPPPPGLFDVHLHF
jgi:hypothetical protein